MLEIEVKAKIEDLDALRERFEKSGCTFSEEISQHDKIYIWQEKTFTQLNPWDNALRIRTTWYMDWSKKHTFNLKQNTWNWLAKIERETDIIDPKQMHESILMMWYKLCSHIQKTRKKGKHPTLWVELCLDTVEWLWSFIEVEKMSDQDPEQVQEELYQFLESHWISRKQRVFKWYDILLHEK